jgi:hypothetical protein
MAQVRPTGQYRHVLRELRKAVRSLFVKRRYLHSSLPKSISPRATRSPVIATQFRSLFEQAKDSADEARFSQDIENALTFMRAQRVHKVRRLYSMPDERAG